MMDVQMSHATIISPNAIHATEPDADLKKLNSEGPEPPNPDDGGFEGWPNNTIASMPLATSARKRKPATSAATMTLARRDRPDGASRSGPTRGATNMTCSNAKIVHAVRKG